MTLEELCLAVRTHSAQRIIPELIGEGTVQVRNIADDSRAVQPGDLFACIPGERHDGHDHAADALHHGAVALLVERRLPLDVPQILVGRVRDAVGECAAAICGYPSEQMTVIGITGTNGKTTTAHVVGAVLRGAGREVRVMGTLTDTLTTPEAVALQTQLAQWQRAGVDTVVMEVSSHSLVHARVDGMRFALGVFTNLGRDHLDLHGSLEAYFRAKARLFTPALCSRAVINTSDPYGALLTDAAEIPMVAVDQERLSNVQIAVNRITGTWGDVTIDVALGGRTNLANLLVALQIAHELGVSPEQAAAGVAAMEQIPGRLEVITMPGDSYGPHGPLRDVGTVIVDFAHTAEGIAELLGSLRAMGTYRRILVVFGCGGNRDRAKRPAMGAAAANGAECVVLTSDNPRDEDPAQIIEEIHAGIPPQTAARVIVEIERRAAIARGLAEMGPDDVLVVAGKGHESTETVGDQQRWFNDADVIRELLAAQIGTGSNERDGLVERGEG